MIYIYTWLWLRASRRWGSWESFWRESSSWHTGRVWLWQSTCRCWSCTGWESKPCTAKRPAMSTCRREVARTPSDLWPRTPSPRAWPGQRLEGRTRPNWRSTDLTGSWVCVRWPLRYKPVRCPAPCRIWWGRTCRWWWRAANSGRQSRGRHRQKIEKKCWGFCQRSDRGPSQAWIWTPGLLECSDRKATTFPRDKR